MALLEMKNLIDIGIIWILQSISGLNIDLLRYISVRGLDLKVGLKSKNSLLKGKKLFLIFDAKASNFIVNTNFDTPKNFFDTFKLQPRNFAKFLEWLVTLKLTGV